MSRTGFEDAAGFRLDVAAALPGGDPLAEALAAGETPSPELVAASGHVGGVSPLVGVTCLTVIALGLAGIVWMSQRSTITSHVPLARSPEIMAERARTIAADLGYSEPDADVAYGYDLKGDVLQHIHQNDASPARWDILRSDRLTALGFWYRQSPEPLSPVRISPVTMGRVTRTDPPQDVPGMLTIEMDPGGRLAHLTAVPPRVAQPTAGGSSPDWARLFRHAGLDIDRFTPGRPRLVPPAFADQRGAWEGVLPDGRQTRVRIEAAAYAGVPVFFDLVAPWNEAASAAPSRRPATNAPLFLYAIIFVVSLLLVRHNLRLGRADRRGAFRTAAVTAIATLAAGGWLAQDASEFLPFVGNGLALALWAAVVPWTFYIALEPYVRRVWPEMLIGWSRLISGRIRDPLIGRDVLVGIIGGIAMAALTHLRVLTPAWTGLPSPVPVGSIGGRADQVLTLLANGREALAILPLSVTNALFIGLLSAITLVLLTMLLRGRRQAAVAWVLIWTVANQPPSPGDPIADLAYKAGAFTIGIVLLVRFGLLASVVHLITSVLLALIELRFDSGVPYSIGAYVIVGAVAVLALYAFHTALAGQSVFGSLLREDARAV